MIDITRQLLVISFFEVIQMPRRKINLPVSSDSSVVELSTGRLLEKTALPVLCERIRFYRESRGLEQKAFAARLGVSANAASNWECGRSRPDVNLLPAICRALGITLYELYGESPPAELLSPREKKLLDGYRGLSTGNQYAVDKAVETLSFVQNVQSRPAIRELLYFERSLSAGAADPTEFEQDAEPFYLYVSPEAERADYVFNVNGDSMEPDYHTGDLVLVEKLSGGSSLHYGEIGAFIVGNETYIKQYEPDGLHSLNKKYEVLHFGEDQAVYLIGRVVGIVSQADIPAKADVEAYLTLRNFARV